MLSFYFSFKNEDALRFNEEKLFFVVLKLLTAPHEPSKAGTAKHKWGVFSNCGRSAGL